MSFDIRFRQPSNILISGPSQSGKSNFIYKLLLYKNQLINPIPKTIIYVYSGQACVGDHNILQGQLAIFSQKGLLRFRSSESSVLQCIVVSGEPINEPVARGGPFVMNTKAEILEAVNDYNKGTFVK